MYDGFPGGIPNREGKEAQRERAGLTAGPVLRPRPSARARGGPPPGGAQARAATLSPPPPAPAPCSPGRAEEAEVGSSAAGAGSPGGPRDAATAAYGGREVGFRAAWAQSAVQDFSRRRAERSLAAGWSRRPSGRER